MTGTQDPALLEALKHGARALRDAGIAYTVGGGIAVWARGGPPTEHDIDFVICEQDADAALRACAGRGLRTAVPPEGWLVKAWHDDVLIDLIFRPTGVVVDDAFFARCETMNVAAVQMPVMSANDIMTTKLFTLTEHQLDYGPVLEYARSLREQIDWRTLERRTSASPFARAFFTLVSVLHISEAVGPVPAGATNAGDAARRPSRPQSQGLATAGPGVRTAP